MNWKSVFFIAVLSASGFVQAAEIHVNYRSLGSDQWSASFNVMNDGLPTKISEFTVYFPESSFLDLALRGAPDTWSTLLIPGDPAIPAPGFLDGLILNSAAPLTAGQNADGFLVNFRYFGVGTPGRLDFDIVDINYQTIFSGKTTVTVVPEPPASIALVGGIILIGLCRLVQQKREAIK